MKKLIVHVMALFLFGIAHSQESTKEAIQNIWDDGKPNQADVESSIKAAQNFVMPNMGPVKLNPFYEADDGSLIFVRQIGDMMYALADRYDRRYASVWVGKIDRNTIDVKYFFIPKGGAKGHGKIKLKVTGSGRSQKLELDAAAAINKLSELNFKSMTTVAKLKDRLPVNDRAWYRGNSLDNLTGRWKVDNVAQDYFLDLGKTIVGYSCGGRETAHSRPQFATLFFGERTGNTVKGNYVDLPLGHTYGAGEASFNIIGPHHVRATQDHFYYGVKRERVQEDKREIVK